MDPPCYGSASIPLQIFALLPWTPVVQAHYNLAEPSSSNQTTTPPTSPTPSTALTSTSNIRYAGPSNEVPPRIPVLAFGDFAPNNGHETPHPHPTTRAIPATPFDTPRPPAVRVIEEPSRDAGRFYRTAPSDGGYTTTYENASAIPPIAAHRRQYSGRNTPLGWRNQEGSSTPGPQRRRSSRNAHRMGEHPHRPASSVEFAPYAPFHPAELAPRSSHRGTPPPYREPRGRQLPHEHKVEYTFQGEYIIISIHSSHPIRYVDADTIAHNFELQIQSGEFNPDREDPGNLHREAQGDQQDV